MGGNEEGFFASLRMTANTNNNTDTTNTNDNTISINTTDTNSTANNNAGTDTTNTNINTTDTTNHTNTSNDCPYRRELGGGEPWWRRVATDPRKPDEGSGTRKTGPDWHAGMTAKGRDGDAPGLAFFWAHAQSRSRIARAASLVRSLFSPAGPTQDGHPWSHGHAAINSCVRRNRSLCAR